MPPTQAEGGTPGRIRSAVRRSAAVAWLAAALLLAASGADAAAAAQPGVAGASARIAAARTVPRFTPPGPAFDAKRASGRTIFEIPITSTVPFVASVEAGMRQAAGAVGARLVVYPNQGAPLDWARGLDAAIARRADAITLLAQDPALLAPQITRARRAGIAVIVVRSSGEGEPCPRDRRGRPYGTACVPGPFERAGRLEADRVIARSGGRARVLVVTSNDARSTGPLVRGLREEFRARCSSCRLHFEDVAIPRWATELQMRVQAALLSDPGISWVIPIYDGMSQFAVPAIRATGRAGRVRIATFNGTPFVLRQLADGDVVDMDAGENLSWLGWAAMDQTLRVLAGVRPVASERTPLRVFDDGNVAEAGSPPRADAGYGMSFMGGYRRLWRIP